MNIKNSKEIEIDGEESNEPKRESVEDEKEIYPANIKIEREQFSVFELKRKYDRKQIVIDPEFQRGANVWKNPQKSELIESILMGIPLPLIYLFEKEDKTIIIIDGRQRLTALFEFLNKTYSLSSLKILDKLNGKKFNQLEPNLQANLEDYQIITHTIKPPTPDRIKFDIFDRVNRGGTPLNNQEMRNALYQGEATKLLKKLSELDIFKKATANSITSKRMRDRYIINRFLAFYLWRKGLLKDTRNELIRYKSDIDEFLAKSMEFMNNSDGKKKFMSDNEHSKLIKELEEVFKKAMSNSYKVFGLNCFRLPSTNNRKNPINMALFESFSYLMSYDILKVSNIILKQKHKDFINKILELKSTPTNIDSRKKVEARFEFAEETMEEILNAK